MRVHCDVCGGEPAAVLCCADEAALCSACDRRVHRANKLAGKHRRLELLHPDDPADADVGPLCDVCKERRGLVFCVEDRAILCADCDEPIHSANDLTAKHSRFLLVGAKLSAPLVDQAPPPSPDRSGEPDDVVPAATACARSPSPIKSSVLDGCNSNDGQNGGARISDYLTNICPGWRVDDLLFDDAAFSAAAAAKAGRGEHEQVPSMDADLFDVVAGRPEKRGAWAAPAWTAGELGYLDEVPAAPITTAKAGKQGRARETYWINSDSDSDAFAVPEISPPPAKKARPSSFWCF